MWHDACMLCVLRPGRGLRLLAPECRGLLAGGLLCPNCVQRFVQFEERTPGAEACTAELNGGNPQ